MAVKRDADARRTAEGTNGAAQKMLVVPQTVQISVTEAARQEEENAREAAEADAQHRWTQPKTDWSVRDAFDLTPDYARVRGNLLHLQALAARLYLPFSLAPMREYGVVDVPDAAFFEAVDKNTDALMDATYRPPGTPRARQYEENGPVWTAEDLNRIERAHARSKDNLTAQQNARQVLKFVMGGDAFGACIQ